MARKGKKGGNKKQKGKDKQRLIKQIKKVGKKKSKGKCMSQSPFILIQYNHMYICDCQHHMYMSQPCFIVFVCVVLIVVYVYLAIASPKTGKYIKKSQHTRYSTKKYKQSSKQNVSLHVALHLAKLFSSFLPYRYTAKSIVHG